MQVAKNPATNVAFLILLALLFSAFLFKAQLSAPPSVAETKASTGFDTTAAIARLSRILGDERPHSVDTPANDAVMERLLIEIKALGLTPEVRDDFACRSAKRWNSAGCARVRNVVVRMGPAGGNAVLVAAHYDSVPAGPGAADDGAGVASLLEVGAQLRGKALSKPVILLFTDGEEVGLLGAASFVRRDPYANDVVFAINLEARGTSGPAIMFQTSTANGPALAVFGSNIARPVANSLAADIYRSLPNDTDATEFLARGYGVLNYAFIEPLARYHSPIDSLKYLDQNSVGHLGSSALVAVQGFLAQPVKNAESTESVIYTDIVGRGFLVMPVVAGAVMLGLGFLAALAMFIRAGGGGSLSALTTPFSAALIAGGACFAATAIIGAVKPEKLWWYSYPQAAIALVAAAGLLGVTLALLALARNVSPSRTFAAAWIWLFALGCVGGFFSSGSLILLAPAAGAFAACWLITMWRPNVSPLLWLIPPIVLLTIMLPTLSFAGAALGYSMAWAVAAVSALLFMPALALCLFTKPIDWRYATAPALALVGGTVWSISVPAYTAQTPAPLNIQHWESDGPKAHWVLAPDDLQPVPAALQRLLPFKNVPVPGNATERTAALAERSGGAMPEVKVVSDVTIAGKRQVVLEVVTVAADEIQLSAPKEAGLTAISFGGETFQYEPGSAKTFQCRGRSCSTWRMTMTIGSGRHKFSARAIRWGLDDTGKPLQAARPANSLPNQRGDVRVATRDFSL